MNSGSFEFRSSSDLSGASRGTAPGVSPSLRARALTCIASMTRSSAPALLSATSPAGERSNLTDSADSMVVTMTLADSFACTIFTMSSFVSDPPAWARTALASPRHARTANPRPAPGLGISTSCHRRVVPALRRDTQNAQIRGLRGHRRDVTFYDGQLDFYDIAEGSAVRALAGEAPITGCLPIGLPGLFEAGTGDIIAVSRASGGACCHPPRAPLAQLDRASGYEPGGRKFESCRARHFFRANRPVPARELKTRTLFSFAVTISVTTASYRAAAAARFRTASRMSPELTM